MIVPFFSRRGCFAIHKPERREERDGGPSLRLIQISLDLHLLQKPVPNLRRQAAPNFYVGRRLTWQFGSFCADNSLSCLTAHHERSPRGLSTSPIAGEILPHLPDSSGNLKNSVRVCLRPLLLPAYSPQVARSLSEFAQPALSVGP